MTAAILPRTLIQRAIDSHEVLIALLAVAGIFAHLVMRFLLDMSVEQTNIVLWVVLALGGTPLVWQLLRKALSGQFGSDLLAGISICTAVALEEYLAGAFVVLMLSGGEALERLAVGRASSVLDALAKRMPTIAHRRNADGIQDVPLAQVQKGDELVIYPHEVCPVDGVVLEGHGAMDESFLTGESLQISKSPGASVISGATNGEYAITIRTERVAGDSRYARITKVMEETQRQRVPMRRIGDKLGAWYTPVAVVIALLSWWLSGDATRFLAVLVVATPCPLLIAIPVAIIGSVSRAASAGVVVRDPAILEVLDTCTTAILDKTGTLTVGAPAVSEILTFDGFSEERALALAGSVEQYSRHPVALAIVNRAKVAKATLVEADNICEEAGSGISGTVNGVIAKLGNRGIAAESEIQRANLPEAQVGGLECLLTANGRIVALFRFRDPPRDDAGTFLAQLRKQHGISRVMIVSGDRDAEVRHLAERVGITEIFSEQSPEQKVEIVRQQTARSRTVYIGDGVNDAPALLAATVGISLGSGNDITVEAAGAVVLEPSLAKVLTLFSIAGRMRRIAMQSAVGGMALSIIGMGLAAAGLLTPVAGAVMQEGIDLWAVLNALRVSSGSSSKLR